MGVGGLIGSYSIMVKGLQSLKLWLLCTSTTTVFSSITIFVSNDYDLVDLYSFISIGGESYYNDLNKLVFFSVVAVYTNDSTVTSFTKGVTTTSNLCSSFVGFKLMVSKF